MELIRYNGFLFFGSVLFLFIISHQCDEFVQFNFEDCASLKDICKSANWKLPVSDPECMILYYHMRLRYGSDFVQSVYTDTKMLNAQNIIDPSQRNYDYWRLFFNEVASRAKYVEPFLVATKLKNVPSDNIEWLMVKYFVEPKIKMIVNPDDQNTIRSVMESPLESKIDYVKRFVYISKLYYAIIPSSKREGILKYIGADYSDNLDNDMAADKIADAFGEDFVKFIKSMLDLDHSFKEYNDRYWSMFFDKVADLVIYVQPFLRVVKLKKIPTDDADWKAVVSVMQPKIQMIVNPDDQNTIRSVMESPLESKIDYVKRFVYISKLYYAIIPSSKREGILKYIGADYSDNLDNDMAADKIADAFGEDFAKFIKSMLDLDHSLKEYNDRYWSMFFDKVADLVIYVQPFLRVVKLKKIPTDDADWKAVVSVMQPKIQTIVIRHDKNKIQSLMDNTYKSKLEYVKAFVKMSKYYFSLIPSSKVDAFMQYFRCNESDTVKNVVQKIGEMYFIVRDAYAISDAVSLSRSFMENSERIVLMMNRFSIEDCKSLITKVVILEEYYGLRLKTLNQRDLKKLHQSDIDDFLNADDTLITYKASTLYPFSTPRTSTSITKQNTIVTTSTKLLTKVYYDYMKKYKSPLEEKNIGEKNAAKLSNHYNMCRLMLLTDKPVYITNIRKILAGKTDEEICLAWQMLYEKLCTFIHEPDNRLEERITNEEKIEAVMNLKIEEDVRELLISIIEIDSRSSQKTTDTMDQSNTGASDSS